MFDKLVDVLLELAGLFKFWTVLDPYEQGVLLRLGTYVTVLEPGFHFIWPIGVDRVIAEHVVPRTHSLGPQSATTLDGKQIGFEAVITLRVRDIKVAFLEVEHGEDAVKDSCSGTICQVLSQCTWSAIIASESDVLDRITAACRKKGFRFGLEIMGVQFSTMSIVRTIRILGAIH